MKLGIKMLLCVIASIILLGSFAHAEMNLWQNVILDNSTSITRYHAFYQFQDTSTMTNVYGMTAGKSKDIPMELYYVVASLPKNLTGCIGGCSGSVDYCNLSVSHFKNIYDSYGNRINTTTETTSMNFGTNVSINSGSLFFNLRSDDTITADMDCHYTDSDELYADNYLVGRYTTFLPSFECKGCEDYTLEELSNEVERADEITANELEIYNGIQTIVDWNYTIWLIASWIVKIGFVYVGIGLIFAGGYYFYVFLKNLAGEI